MTARTRTRLAVLLFIPLAGLLVGVFACLPAPIGDPEKSKIDDSLTGVWQAVADKPTEDNGIAIAILRPYDAHTYFIQYLSSDKKEGEDKVSVLNYKAWIAPVGGENFLVCENLDDKSFLTPATQPDRYYFVARIVRHEGNITLRPLNENSDLLKDLTTRDKIEEAVKNHLNDDSLYSAPVSFKKLPPEQLDIVDQLRKRANVGIQ